MRERLWAPPAGMRHRSQHRLRAQCRFESYASRSAAKRSARTAVSRPEGHAPRGHTPHDNTDVCEAERNAPTSRCRPCSALRWTRADRSSTRWTELEHVEMMRVTTLWKPHRQFEGIQSRERGIVRVGDLAAAFE